MNNYYGWVLLNVIMNNMNYYSIIIPTLFELKIVPNIYHTVSNSLKTKQENN